MSEPEILSIEEVRGIGAAMEEKGVSPSDWTVRRLCATVESWHRTAASRHEAMTAAAEERDRLRADIDRRREVWQEDFVKLQRAEIDRDNLEAESHRLRALVGRMREAIQHRVDEAEPLSGDPRAPCPGWVDEVKALLTDPDGQGAAEELDGLRAAERRLANIHDLCREKLGQVRSGELTEEIVGRVAEELRRKNDLLRELTSFAGHVVGELGIDGWEPEAGNECLRLIRERAEQLENLRWAERRLANITQTCRSEFGQSRTGEPAEAILDRVVEELRLLREWEAASVAILDCVGDPREAHRTQRNAWAALRAFREGQE